MPHKNSGLKSYLLLGFWLFSGLLFSAHAGDDLSRDTLQPAPPDTLPWLILVSDEYYPDDSTLAEEEHADHFVDDINGIEYCEAVSYDQYYEIWDTLNINPYRINMRLKSDTTLLQLIHDEHCDYAHPVCGIVTSEFGMRGNRYHYGIDVDLETGDAVLSCFEGTVRIARYSPTYGYYVIVRHLNGLETLYAHLSKILVSSGEYVQAGDLLGLGGNTGRSRGSHLHFEVRFLGQQINPREVIDFDQFMAAAKQFPVTAQSFNYLKASDAQKAALASRKYYKVRRGDTLGKIAKRHGTTVKKLCKINGISTKARLKPGRKIRVA